MSRNFELMTQLELEAGVADKPRPGSPNRAAAVDVVPILSSHTSNVGGEEILRLIQRIFLSANGCAPRQVVLCGVDDENGSSSVCAHGWTDSRRQQFAACLPGRRQRAFAAPVGPVWHRRDESFLRPVRSSCATSV